MAILLDEARWPAHGTVWAHLVSDASYAELHAFARQLRLPRRGFDLDHYDLPAQRRAEALELGAQPVNARELVRRLEGSGLRVRQADRAALKAVRRLEFLREEWVQLGTRLGVTGGRSDAGTDRWSALGEDLLHRWAAPERHYHDARHLEDVLLALDLLYLNGETVDDTTLLAAWFHDAIYTGSTGADEDASAQLAEAKLTAAGVAPSVVAHAAQLIRATVPAGVSSDAPAAASTIDSTNVRPDPISPISITGTISTSGNNTAASPSETLDNSTSPGAALLDADLWIFASHPKRYAEYSSAVRQEYAHVSDHDFAVGRSGILEAYLRRPHIYFTPTASQHWEAAARRNVTAELARLTS